MVNDGDEETNRECTAFRREVLLMRRLSVSDIISIVIATMFLTILTGTLIGYVIIFGRDRSRNQYTVLRLSPESNPRGREEDYILRCGDTILRYSFETGEETEYDIEVPEGKRIENGGAAVGDQMYYALTDHTVRRFDCGTQTDEEIFSEMEVCSMCGWDHWLEGAYIYITRSERNLLLNVNHNIFICPIDGDLKTDCVEVNTLFPKEDRTGREQVVLYRGMGIRRLYDVEKEKYQITDFWEEENGLAIFIYGDRYIIKAGGERVVLKHKLGLCDYSYQVEGDSEEHEIKYLNVPVCEYAYIQRNKLTTDNGEIIGLLHVPENLRCNPFDPSQDELKYDVLFSLNPETGENSILYQTKNNRTRVIGYQNGVIYLMKNYRNHYGIYTKTEGSKKAELFLELPGDTGYKFDWQGDYLIVIRQNSIFGAYNVE